MPKRSIPILIAVFLTLTFSSCTCLYFNTFHNIRKNFNGAEKTRKKDGRDEARGAEVKQYNDAITKASRVLERHPTSSYVDDALYIIGASYYYLGEYNKSARKFKELFANYPESEYIAKSRILLAKAKLQLKEEAEAVVIFEEIFEEEGDKQMKANAARALGEYYFEAKEYDAATMYFASLIDSLGEESDKLRALLYVADGHFEKYVFDKALDNFRQALKYEPDTLQYYRIMFRMAECDYFLNNLDGGLDKLAKLAKDELYYDSLAPIRLKMAEGYEWDGDYESAINTYDKVIVENPGADAAAVAYYSLGLIYQYDMEDLDKARDYYQKAREERRNSSVYQEATRRASKLAMLERYVKSGEVGLEADSTGQLDDDMRDQLAQNQFLLGELFYFDLEKPDSAVNAFQALIERYPESIYGPRALMSMSYIYRNDYFDTTGADSLLRQVLVRYPKFDEAEEVIGFLGLTGTIADTGYASISFRRAENFLERFLKLDSSMYFMRLVADSILAADSGRKKDSGAVSDSIPLPDSLRLSDSMQVEDIMLMGDSTPPVDSAAKPDSMMITQSISNAVSDQQSAAASLTDSIRLADSIRYAEARRAADSMQQAFLNRTSDSARITDSIQREDSIRAMELMHVADSLRRNQDSLVSENLLAANSQKMTDSLPVSDTISAEDDIRLSELLATTDTAQTMDSTAAFDSTRPADSPGIPESPDIADSMTGSIFEAAEDSIPFVGPLLPEESPPATDAMTANDSEASLQTALARDTLSVFDSLALSRSMMATEESAAVSDTMAGKDSAASLQAALASDTLSVFDSLALSRSMTGAETGPTADTMAAVGPTQSGAEPAIADSAEAALEEVAIDYWRVAFDSASTEYDPELYTLLDSAQYYYHIVVDSFPFSKYSIKARYVLLWMYDKYLAPGDSSMITLYKLFVDSFPDNEYAQMIADEYNIRGTGAKPKKTLDDLIPEKPKEEDVDSSAFASHDIPDEDVDSTPVPGQESRFITDEDGNVLEPAEKYFLREDVPFKYPLEALAFNIEDKLYFQIRIDFSGEVAEAVLMNETPSAELNERVIETVKNTKFDAGKIPPELYDTWFYYTFTVTIPYDLKQ